MSHDTITRIDQRPDPVPALIDVHQAIRLADRLGLLALPADQAWTHVIGALNADADPGYVFAEDSTASVPYDTATKEVDAYVAELILDIPDEEPPSDEEAGNSEHRTTETPVLAG